MVIILSMVRLSVTKKTPYNASRLEQNTLKGYTGTVGWPSGSLMTPILSYFKPFKMLSLNAFK